MLVKCIFVCLLHCYCKVFVSLKIPAQWKHVEIKTAEVLKRTLVGTDPPQVNVVSLQLFINEKLRSHCNREAGIPPDYCKEALKKGTYATIPRSTGAHCWRTLFILTLFLACRHICVIRLFVWPLSILFLFPLLFRGARICPS